MAGVENLAEDGFDVGRIPKVVKSRVLGPGIWYRPALFLAPANPAAGRVGRDQIPILAP